MTSSISDLAYSRNGRFFAVAGWRGAEVTKLAGSGQSAAPLALADPDNVTTRCVQFSPDSTLLAVGALRSDVRVWSTRNWNLRVFKALSSYGKTDSIAFTPDGRRMLSLTRGGRVVVWDTLRGKQVDVLHAHAPLHVADEYLCRGTIRVLPDGLRFVTSSPSDDLVKIWRLENGRLSFQIRCAGGRVLCSELSADGRRIALCPDRDDSPVELWDFQTRRRTCALKASAASHAWSASFNPDGSRLAVGRANGDVEVWDTLTGRLYCSLHVLRSAVYDVCFSPDGSRLTAGGYHMGQVYQWVASSDAEIAAYQRAQQTKAVRQAKGGRK